MPEAIRCKVPPNESLLICNALCEFSDETFVYILPNNNPNPDDKVDFYYGPFLIGPKLIPLKNKLQITYEINNPQLGIYKYDVYNKEWNFVDNQFDKDGIKATIKSGGIFSIIKDEVPPSIQKPVPQIGSTYRRDHFNLIQFYIDDISSGIRDDTNIKVFLDNHQIIVEYNPYRKLVYYELENPLHIGNHQIRIEVIDNSKNKSSINGTFYIK